MPFGELVVGPPGSGKSTYAYGKQQLFNAMKRPLAIINLDPANETMSYDCSINISELITLQHVMETYRLGPNGAMLYCMEYLEVNFDWLEEELGKLPRDAYVVFDLPGQVELWTNHVTLKTIVQRLTKSGYRLAAVNLCDAHNVTDAANYVSVLLLSLRTMLQLELPQINVLSKVDLVAQYGQLDFNLDFYTEVQDLSYLANLLNMHSPRYAALNMTICSLIEDYSLVGFETLAVEDKNSMLHLTKVIDRAIGTVFVPPSDAAIPDGAFNPTNAPPSERPNTYSLFSSAVGQLQGPAGNARDVQERWIDEREVFDAHEKMQWRAEGETLAKEKEANLQPNKVKIRERK